MLRLLGPKTRADPGTGLRSGLYPSAQVPTLLDEPLAETAAFAPWLLRVG